MYKLYNLENNPQIINTVRNFKWTRNLPGGWLDYGPPRKVAGYGDGQKITDDGKKHGDKWEYTAWSASVPYTNMTSVTKTESIPTDFLKSGILEHVRNCLRDFGAVVDDTSGTGIWCNYYDQETDYISGHKDDEDYYAKNYNNDPLFVSLTLFEDEIKSDKHTARFQIKPDKKWEEISLPHMSLLVMSGDIEHRVMKPKSGEFRKRYNITFRTPVSKEEDALKNFRFFSNFGRYYKLCYALFVPDIVFTDKLPEKGVILKYLRDKDMAVLGNKKYKTLNDISNYTKSLKRHSEQTTIYLIRNIDINRKDIVKDIKEQFTVKSNPPATTTNQALYIMLTY